MNWLKRTFSRMASLVLCLLVFGATSVARAEQVPKIYWHSYNLPPGMCVDVEGGDRCFVNYMVSLLQEKLKDDYQHQSYPTTLKRLLTELERGQELIVAPALSYTKERAEFIQFSNSSPFPRLPYIVAIRQEDKNLFSEYVSPDGFIDLSLLMSSPLKTLLFEGRSYAHLDKIIRKSRNNAHTLVNYDNLKGMTFLQLKRIDYLIIYPPQAKFAQQYLDKEGFEILSYPIKGMPLYEGAALGTIKGKAGSELLEKINSLFYDEEIIARSTANYRAWLPDNLRIHYDAVAKQYQIDRIVMDKK